MPRDKTVILTDWSRIRSGIDWKALECAGLPLGQSWKGRLTALEDLGTFSKSVAKGLYGYFSPKRASRRQC